MAWVNADECGEATVGPGDDTLLADDIDESSEQFRDQFGVLDAVSLGVDYPDDKRLVVRQLRSRASLAARAELLFPKLLIPRARSRRAAAH
jgi:hypothetical protein